MTKRSKKIRCRNSKCTPPTYCPACCYKGWVGNWKYNYYAERTANGFSPEAYAESVGNGSKHDPLLLDDDDFDKYLDKRLGK